MIFHLDRGGAPARRPDLDAFIARLISRRDEAEYLADRLIEALDLADGDPDLEPDVDEETLGWPANASQLDLGQNTPDGDLTAPERHGIGFLKCGEDDREPSLGAPEVEFTTRGLPHARGHVDQRRWADGGADNDDGEPSLGSISPLCAEDSGTWLRDQREWSTGYQRDPQRDECETVSEDEGADIQAQRHDGDDVIDGDEVEDVGGEPSLGSPEIHHNQTRWGQGDKGSREGDHDERQDLGAFGWEERERRETARGQARALIERHRASRRRVPKPGTFVPCLNVVTVNGVRVAGELYV